MTTAAKKKAAADKDEAPKGFIGASEIAKRMSLDPKSVRKYIRKANGKAPGTRYEYTEAQAKKVIEEILALRSHDDAEKATKIIEYPFSPTMRSG